MTIFPCVLGRPDPKIVFFGYRGTGKSTLLNSVAGSIIFQSGPSRGFTTKVEKKCVENTTYCDTPGFDYYNEKKTKEAGEAISNFLKEGGCCKILFVVTVRDSRAGGWIRYGDNANMRLILEAAPEIGSSFGVIVNHCSEKEISKLSNSERFAENIFKCIKPEHHNGSIHFVKEDPNLRNNENVLIEASQIQDLKDFIENKVPVIEMTKNMSANVKADKFGGKI